MKHSEAMDFSDEAVKCGNGLFRQSSLWQWPFQMKQSIVAMDFLDEAVSVAMDFSDEEVCGNGFSDEAVCGNGLFR